MSSGCMLPSAYHRDLIQSLQPPTPLHLVGIVHIKETLVRNMDNESIKKLKRLFLSLQKQFTHLPEQIGRGSLPQRRRQPRWYPQSGRKLVKTSSKQIMLIMSSKSESLFTTCSFLCFIKPFLKIKYKSNDVKDEIPICLFTQAVNML